MPVGLGRVMPEAHPIESRATSDGLDVAPLQGFRTGPPFRYVLHGQALRLEKHQEGYAAASGYTPSTVPGGAPDEMAGLVSVAQAARDAGLRTDATEPQPAETI